ncbi:MAG: AbrB family transcriptional regulator [Corynebacterium sp.]|nr:AbrB family transcriptional regulator [Corynebacterium sp.]
MLRHPLFPAGTSRWACTLLLSLGLGVLFSWVTMPAAWILAGIIGAGIVALTTQHELAINPKLFNFCRGTIGILAGVPLLQSDLQTLAHFVLPGLFATFVSLAIVVAGGYFLARRRPEISAETGLLSLLPGGASIMPTLAAELHADFRYVALAQYLRLLVVSISLPIIAHWANPRATTTMTNSGIQPWWILLILIMIAIFGAPIGKFLHLPAAAVFGPMLAAVAVGLVFPAEYSLVPPMWMRILAFLAIGWMCGGSLSVGALRHFRSLLPATLTFIAVLMAGCAATAYCLHLWLGLDYFNAYLATSPGALETVIALGSTSADLDAVVAIQLIRLLVILVVAGYLPQILQWARRHRNTGT